MLSVINLMAGSSIDPVTLAVVSGAMDSAIREMTIIVRRSAMSPVLAIGNDFSNTIFDSQPSMVAQGNDQPVHLGALIFATKEVASYFGSELGPGDVIYHNDPRTGGSHLPDMTLYKPVFYDGELLFWTVNRSHMNETGGPVAGGYNPGAEEIWAEGLRISPVKLYEGGHPRRDVIDLLLTNMRTRRQMRGDLGAQIAACTRAEQRLLALVKRYGKDDVKACLKEILDRAERLMREEIAAIPDGVYHGSAIVEGDGRRWEDLAINCMVKVTGNDIDIHLDSPNQVRGYINSYGPNTISAVYLALLTYINPDVPHNEGLYRPVKVDPGPPGTLVNAVEPAACGLSTTTPNDNIVTAVRNALSEALPERAGAAWAPACIMSLFGTDSRSDEEYAYYSHMTGWGGGGAFYGKDGEPCLGSIGAAAAAMTGDIETVEHLVPIHIHRYELYADSGSPGRWRGGLGAIVEFEVVNHEALYTQFGDGVKYPAPSVLGAQSPYLHERVYRKYILRGDGRREVIPAHGVGHIAPGERVVVHNAGGGAVGDPFNRDVNAVREDVFHAYVTPERAREEYGVVLDPNTLEINVEASDSMRRQRHLSEHPS